jgi:hypothetical protein
MSEEQYIYVEFPPNDPLNPLNPIDFIGRTAVVISTRKKWYSDGVSWESETGAGSGVGSLDTTSPISGNPAGLQTPGQMAATIQAQAAQIAALQAFKAAIDSDNNDKIDMENQDDAAFLFPTPLLQWVQPHLFGRIPHVTLLDSSGNQIQADVKATTTSIIVDFGAPQSGLIILR